MLIESSAPSAPEPSSPKAFGWLIVAVTLFFAVRSVLENKPELFSYVLSGLAFILIGLTVWLPWLFGPFNRAWHQFGLLLGKIVSPIVLGFIFFGILTPLALFLKLMKRDPLHLKPRQQKSYWVIRDHQESDTDFFNHPY